MGKFKLPDPEGSTALSEISSRKSLNKKGKRSTGPAEEAFRRMAVRYRLENSGASAATTGSNRSASGSVEGVLDYRREQTLTNKGKLEKILGEELKNNMRPAIASLSNQDLNILVSFDGWVKEAKNKSLKDIINEVAGSGSKIQENSAVKEWGVKRKQGYEPFRKLMGEESAPRTGPIRYDTVVSDIRGPSSFSA
jgi:hypothetical protein